MFNPVNYQKTRLPLDQAQTLPSHCYIAEEFYQREVETIFTTSWHFVGREEELESGDFIVVDTVAGSALICRSASGELGAFVNACRHRGTRLKDGSGNCRSVICPYHGWSYAMDGELRAAPGMQGIQDFDLNNFGLQKLRIESWGGFVFISFAESAPALIEWLGNLPEKMQQHKPVELVCVKRLEFIVAANWKFLIENALEAYHTGLVHRETLGQQDSAAVTTQGQWDALYVLSETDKGVGTLPGQSQLLPFIAGLTGAAARGTWFTVIYPCTQIVFSQDSVWWLDFKPLGVDRTSLTLGACFPKSTIALKDFETLVKPHYTRWVVATPEDNHIAELQQLGHCAGITAPGRYASSEHCVHGLNNWVLDRVLDSPGRSENPEHIR